jgi:two-component system cell cycle response regulator
MMAPKKESEIAEKTIITSIEKKISKASKKRPYLFFLSGPLLGKLYALKDGSIIIGRGEDADIKIDDQRVSRRHLKLVVEGEKASIEDLGSTNGTFVNGKRISKKVLSPDDKVQLSPSSIFKFSLTDEDERFAIDELYELGVLDPLTNLYNKRFFLERIKEEFSISKRKAIPLSLIMIDIDFFKKINDKYGHLAGDATLIRLANIISSVTRGEDIAARYGGEEFVLILRHTDEKGAHSLAERLRNKVESTPIRLEGDVIKVTTSIGVASLPNETLKTPEDLIKAADTALYHSKRSGRNRTTCFSEIK